MSWKNVLRPVPVLLVLWVLASFCGPAAAAVPDVSVRLFDTGPSSPAPLSAETLSGKAGWAEVPEDRTDHRFRGDAVLANGKLMVALRRNGPGVEVYSCTLAEPTRRAVLAPALAGGAVTLASVAIVENTPAGAAVDAAFKTADGRTAVLRFGLEPGQVFVQTEARTGAERLRVRSPSRFLVLPDFFADDMVIDAAKFPVDTGEVPSENFLLRMLPGGEAIVMSVALARDRDARIRLSGRGPQRVIDQTELDYGKDRTIWVAVIEGRGVWHEQSVGEEHAGEILPLPWKMPYPAAWRVDWSRDDGLCGSWEMLIQRSRNVLDKPSLIGGAEPQQGRRRWTTVLGWFEYPCWIDRNGRGNLQPLRDKVVRFEGPAVIYPIGRVRATPLSEFTVVDVVRATLGVGPCEYILDVEGQGAVRRGRATCATRDLLNGIYERKQQKHKRAEIEQALDDVLAFVTHIRDRIEAYRTFGRELPVYLGRQSKDHPELAEFIAEMERLARRIEANVDRRRDKIQTPAYVAELTGQFRRTLLDDEGADALERCKKITRAIVVVGGNQDELVGESRMAVKNLRQAAGLAMAVDPRTAEIAREIRRRTQEVLRNPATYEAPRH